MNSRSSQIESPDSTDSPGRSGAGPMDTLDFRLPEPTLEDIEALRAARRRSVAGADVWRLIEAMDGPTVEDLRRRKITRGEPFRWGVAEGESCPRVRR